MKSSDDYEDFCALDLEFHEAITHACGSPILAQIWKSMELGEWSTNLTIRLVMPSMEDLCKTHQELFDAIINKDPDMAGAVMYKHIKDYCRDVLAKAKEAGDSSIFRDFALSEQTV